jgi:hypothetical protein
VLQFFRGWSSGCPLCGGPADEVEVSLDFWRGGVEPLIISACQDPECVAHYPMVSHEASRSD